MVTIKNLAIDRDGILHGTDAAGLPLEPMNLSEPRPDVFPASFHPTNLDIILHAIANGKLAVPAVDLDESSFQVLAVETDRTTEHAQNSLETGLEARWVPIPFLDATSTAKVHQEPGNGLLAATIVALGVGTLIAAAIARGVEGRGTEHNG
jgi:hypothetical protein